MRLSKQIIQKNCPYCRYNFVTTGIILFLVTSLMFACKVHTYVPNAINIPFFENAKEYQATAYASYNHIEMQNAYSIDSSWGVLANLYGSIPNRYVNVVGYFAEGGGLWQKKIKKHFKVETVMGYGYGSKIYNEHVFTGPFYYIDMNYHRIFTQINFGWILKDFMLGLTCRGSYMYFNSLYYYSERDYYSKPEQYPQVPSYSFNDINLLTIEPALIMRLKFFKKIWFVFEGGTLYPFPEGLYTKHFACNYRNLNPEFFFSSGITIPFHKR